MTYFMVFSVAVVFAIALLLLWKRQIELSKRLDQALQGPKINDYGQSSTQPGSSISRSQLISDLVILVVCLLLAILPFIVALLIDGRNMPELMKDGTDPFQLAFVVSTGVVTVGGLYFAFYQPGKD